ncbi:hypothetical protein [Burkholderia sp. Ac-20353]|uniref:hypothetical protein n=1 Tax=Burkholderia sp. Ac-20353 TaxID=2703894 RepID=UPI00197C0875|nr:hypothetical protein [Burkholderia sp. Ac-20353]MBN3785749.1 hypothetical protein [Burkholderia sp. Ac-20353]
MSDVDDRVAVWQARVAAVAANINALSSAESTMRIRIRAREGHYAGLTKQRADDALKRLGALSDDYLLLARVVDDAHVAQHNGLFVTRETRRERVSALLEGESIVRPSEAVPLNSRTLLDSALGHAAMTPAALLARMQKDFEAARDALADIDGAETAAQAELARLHSEYASLDARATRIKVSAERPSFVELQGLQADPLSARAGMASIGRGLTAWASLLERIERAQAQASEGLARAKATLAELRGLTAAHQAQLQQVTMLLGAQSALSLQHAPADQLAMLASWCDTLDSSLKAGQWDAVNVGLSRIEVALHEALERGRAGLAEAQARCAEVDEIKGQFTALKAKEHALSAQRARAIDTDALRERIAQALSARPVDVAEARSSLRAYQSLLLTLSH